MKFPMTKRPFTPVAPTPEQGDEFERRATALVLETVSEFEHFVHRQKRVLDKKKWKAVKSRESVTVYKKRELDESPERPPPQQLQHQRLLNASGTIDWSQKPKLLAVGSIVGNVDDVMYGVVAPDANCVKVKTAYVDDEIVDAMVLSHIRQATSEDPYRFVGLKWVVKASVNAVAWPRDLVFLEATGVHTQPNGDRYGYHIVHSVELPQCPELTRLGVMRGAVSSCNLFRELPTGGQVDVYMKSFVDPSGNLPEMVAVTSAAHGLIDCWKAVWCAQNKKLAWLIRDAAAAARLRHRERGHDGDGDGHGGFAGVMKTNEKGKHCCALCELKFSAFRTAVTCELCHAVICSRCKTARKLTYASSTTVRTIPTAFCKNCITTANSTNAADFARHEYVVDADEEQWEASSGSTVRSVATERFSRRVASHAHHAGYRTPTTKKTQLHTVARWRGSTTLTESSSVQTSWSVDSSMEECSLSLSLSRDSVSVDDVEANEMGARGSAAPGLDPLIDAPPPLWMQMQQLHLQAEQAYRLTRQNNQAMTQTMSMPRYSSEQRL